MKKPSVCISPLDWGLGHATRCISLIKAFESLDYQIYIATEGYQEVILKEAIPTATFLKLKGYRIKYAKNGFLLPLVLFLQLPKIVISIIGEHKWLQKAQKKYQFDLIVSDNRFGFFHSSISSVFITHQLSVQTPYTWTTKLFQKIQYAWLKKFTACWIPDLAGKNNLAGVLANPLKKPTTRLWYMGCLSRLLLEQNSEALTQSIKNKFLGIISGPEPQRTLLENLVWNSGNILQLNFVMVAGTPLNKEAFKKTNHSIMYPHLSGKDLMKQIQEAEYIICRGGYTTLMELIPFRKKLILIPTPGQTEQIYLGALWQKNGWAICCDQAEFDLAKVLDQASRFNFIQAPFEAFSSFALKNELKQLTL